MIINTAVPPGQSLPDFSKLPGYWEQLQATVMDPGHYVIGRPEFGRVLQQWRFTFRHVVRDRAGEPIFVLQASIPLERRGILLYDLPLPPQSYIGLLREDGYQQARWPVEAGEKIYGRPSPGPLAVLLRARPDLKGGFFEGHSSWIPTEKERFGAFKRLPRASLYAYVSAPVSFIWAQWWRHNAAVLVGFAMFLGIFGYLAYRVTEHERLHSQELISQARRDALTGIPNRTAAEEMLERQIALATEELRDFAVLFFDVDRFKDINDSLGHDMGDQLLIQVATRMAENLRQGDMMARLGGDEFLVILPDSNREATEATAQRLTEAFATSFPIGQVSLAMTCSIGIAMFPDHGQDLRRLLKCADTAMYVAKRRGTGGFAFYEDKMGAHVERRILLETRLRAALERHELLLHFQPIIDLKSGRVVATEALLRWCDGDGRFYSPGEFIPIAESTELIIPIGEWVLQAACAQAKAWLDAGHPVRMAVNLSPRQFTDPKLPDRVRQVLDQTGLPPHLLELEITESTAMHDPQATLQVLVTLKSLGLEIAIDDFGTGYSSLSYLKRIPADTIKIDKAFVEGVATKAEDEAIVRAVLALAASLEKRVVGEGVETHEQMRALAAMGCQMGQGYLFARPAPAEALAHYFAAPQIDAAPVWIGRLRGA